LPIPEAHQSTKNLPGGSKDDGAYTIFPLEKKKHLPEFLPPSCRLVTIQVEKRKKLQPTNSISDLSSSQKVK
jgi:hypothetical protein